MTYNEFIKNILGTRGRFGISDGEYKECHHILPKCIGGSDDEDNLIDLYAREHFIAHKLLAEENPDNSKLCFAYWCMAQAKQPNGNSYELTAEEYETARLALKQMYSNYKRSDDFKRRVSLGMKKQRREAGFSEDHLKHISESLKARSIKMHNMELTMYGTPIRKDGECGLNQQFATRSLKVWCKYNNNVYKFNSIREAGIWWYNECRPLGDRYIECTLQRKIRDMCNGKIVTWGFKKFGRGKDRRILNNEIEWFWEGGDNNG